MGNKVIKAIAIGVCSAVGTLIALPLIGFGSFGIVSGSIAACTQSVIGNVVAGSTFATLTSVGMTSAIPLATTVGVCTGVTFGVLDKKWKNSKLEYRSTNRRSGKINNKLIWTN